ncbi:MAG TPA: carboxypeptidase-like regulatory domain-containing protein, partial [Thermoanaerobaculia bacterium]|nr:carboxypeptidase-like regulatory domain-containing protein [Thermoanaerobaculia bacterium]
MTGTHHAYGRWMRIVSLLLAAALAFPAVAETATVHGRVTIDALPLPGVTVTYEAGVESRTMVTDAKGEYRFQNVPDGDHTITFELDGFAPAERVVRVLAGENEVPPQPLQLAPLTEPFEMACLPCSNVAAVTAEELPSCADYELNQSLMTSAEQGDRSARQLLRERHDQTVSLLERLRI